MRLLLSFACVVIIVMGLKAASDLFIPIMLGMFLALLSLPILNWLDRVGLPRPLAVLATILIDFLILGGIVFLASGVIGDFQEKSKGYAERMRKQAEEFSATIDGKIEKLENFWNRMGLEMQNNEKDEEAHQNGDVGLPPDSTVSSPPLGDSLEPDEKGLGDLTISGNFPTFSEMFSDFFDATRVVEFIGGFDVVSRFTSLASTSFFALIIMIFVLAESGRYAHKVADVLHVKGPDLSRFQNTSQDIQKYLAIKTAVSIATGILAMLTCMIFRVDFPLLWGLVAFLFNYVPAIGSIVAGIPPVLLALILYGFWPAVGVLVCYLVINITIGNFIEPMLLGERFGLSTVIVILSVLVWGYIWGPVGMLLAVPLTMLVKVMLDNSSDFRWISTIMGKGAGEHSEASGKGDAESENAPIDFPDGKRA